MRGLPKTEILYRLKNVAIIRLMGYVRSNIYSE